MGLCICVYMQINVFHCVAVRYHGFVCVPVRVSVFLSVHCDYQSISEMFVYVFLSAQSCLLTGTS